MKAMFSVLLSAVWVLAMIGCQSPTTNVQEEAQATPQPVAESPAETPVAKPEVAMKKSPSNRLPGGVTKAAAEKFKAWGVVHSFLGATVVNGKIISPLEGIALTKDNHVGVTKDAGGSWSFQRHVNGNVLAVDGAVGGPYIAVGKLGYVAISRDGKNWSDLPRMTFDDLVGLTVANGTVVAIGKRGAYVSFNTNGQGLWARLFPEKFKAKNIVHHNGAFIALKGKKAYGSKDGRTWQKLIQAPAIGKGKKVATSKGVCSIGKVGKSKGMVCQVQGLGHGIGPGTAFVDTKGQLAFTNNSGSSWTVAPMPFKGLSTVVGNAGGPYYAIGKKGGLAVSSDAKTWTIKPLNTSKTLRAGIIDGTNIVMVGDSGTIVRSADGGESWSVLPAPMSGSFKSILKRGAKLMIPVKKTAIESTDGGATWTEVVDPAAAEALPKPGKPGKCDARLPNRGEICKFSRARTSPLGLPKVKSFHFKGDSGLAVGDSGLVAFTSDGGASWKAKRGFKFKGLQDFAVRGNLIVAIGGKSVVYSIDGGKTFREAQLPKKIGKIAATHISGDGSVYAVGKKGTILKATGNLTTWLPLYTYPKNKTKYVGIYEVNGVLYAVGMKGEIDRSDNKGARWRIIPSGVKTPVLKMTGEGTTVVAVARSGKRQGNLLLRSNNGGLRFFVQREISTTARPHEFWLKGGQLRYNGRISSDFGASWTPAIKNYQRGSQDIGNGLRIGNYSRYGKDVFYVFGTEAGDWTIVDSFYNKGAWFRCDSGTGCWMVASGQVYRPL